MPENTIAIFAQPRSGSTWLAELLNQISNSIILNEPLWRGPQQTHGIIPRAEDGKVDEVRALNFYFYQPIPEEAAWPEAEIFFDKLFRGGVCKLGLHEFNKLTNIKQAEVFIIKFCYANLLFHWLLARFPIRPIVLLRHPCAVVASQLQHYAWNKLKANPEFKLATFNHNSYFYQYLEILKDIRTPEGIAAAFWAINIKALQQPHVHGKEWYTLAYENFYLNSEQELHRLFRWIGHSEPHLTRADIMRPSSSHEFLEQSQLQLQLANPEKHLGKWREILTNRQISNIMQVVTEIGVDLYTSDNLEPDYSKLQSWA